MNVLCIQNHVFDLDNANHISAEEAYAVIRFRALKDADAYAFVYGNLPSQ